MMIQQWRGQQGAAQRWALVALFGGVLAPLALFGALAAEVWAHEGFPWDGPILRFVHGYASPAHDALMIRISQIGGAGGMVPLCILAVAILLLRRQVRDALFLGLAYGGALALDGIAKALFHSARPMLWLSPAPASGYGFPSGHAMGSLALLAALAILAWPTHWRWPTLILGILAVLLIGLSRVYLGVHYPSDVLAAWLAAIAWVVGLRLILYSRMRLGWLHRPAPQWPRRRPLRPGVR
jgi:membrane-associated phospholipid phosphatase